LSAISVKGNPVASDSVSDAKAAMRRTAMEIRKAAAGRHGTGILAKLPDGILSPALSPAAAVVSAYFAMGDEIDPAPLVAQLVGQGATIVMPCVPGKGVPLVFRAWSPGNQTVAAGFGTREPAPDAPMRDPDVLLVPLLAFDRKGFRLGYGGGYYDRTLQRLRRTAEIVAVGIAYDEQRVDAVPHDANDQPIDWILTPSGLRRLGVDGSLQA
jgi:5-formyltetrahydrofolate cyclo-ligase